MTSAGHRLGIRNAIAKLTAAPVAEVNVSASTAAHETTTASAERRQLTIMFCDLVGSTALSARLDPEDLQGIITAYHRCCTELVERKGGFVAKYMGDGVRHPRSHRLAESRSADPCRSDEVADDGAAAPTITGADKGFPQSIAFWA